MLNLKLEIARPTDLTLSFFRGTMTQAFLMAVACTINASAGTATASPEKPEAWQYDSIDSQMTRSEVDAAIALGNLNAMGRIDKASRLSALYDAMIETERVRIALRESIARRRIVAKRRGEGIKNSLVAKAAAGSAETASSMGTDPASAINVQMTTYQESDFNGISETRGSGTAPSADPGAKLLRPRKYSLSEPDQDPRPELHSGYQPLVVARPPTEHLGSESVQPSTKIDLAMTANVRQSQSIVKTGSRQTEAAPVPSPPLGSKVDLASGGGPAADTQSQLEPVIVDNLIASKQTPVNADAVEKPLSLPQPPPLPQPPVPNQAAAVVVAELPTRTIANSPAEPVASNQDSEQELASMLKTALETDPRPQQVTAETHPTFQRQRANKNLPAAKLPRHQTAASNPPTRSRKIDASPAGYHLAHHPVAVGTKAQVAAEQPTLNAAQPVQEQRPDAQVGTALPQDAGTAEATVAMQWPFTRGGQSEELPTPQNGSDVTLNVDDVDVRTVLEMLAKSYGMNILVAPDVEGIVTANVSGLTPEQTLNSVVRMCGLAVQREDNVILVYPRDNLPRESRQLRVFQLDFARSELIEPTVTGLLSSIGSAYSSTVDELDNRKGREAIVVIDTPEVLAQVENYILQADQPPRQVMIEARVLEIELRDDMEHGVNFEALLGGDFRVGGFRLTDNIATSTNPFFFAEIDSTRLDALITMLETTTDAKTLATPRVMVVNGQNAKIQVGQQLGFAVATVTQTSTIQDVRYLDTGVVLQVTPTISRDNRVLLSVKPKVSSGEINPDTLLPEETTREVETSVMLGNHQGMIIGGLIQEDDRVVIKKLPWLGDVKYVGKLFQRRETARARTEIIVALIPHIVESCEEGHCEIDDPLRKQIEWERTENRLFNGPLNRECRPWEARLPDVTGETGFHRDIDRLRNIDPYGKGCEPIKTGLLSTD